MAFDLKTAIGSIAPTLASMLGGPLAGTAVNALCSAFGLAPTASADDVTKIVQTGMTPETIAAVRAADQKHAEIISQQGIDILKINNDYDAAMALAVIDDKKNARDNSVKGGTARPLFYLSLVLLVCSLGCEAAVLFLGYPKTVPDIVVGRVLGLMDAVAMMVLSFWYGTNNASERKTELLAQSTPVK